MSYEEFWEKDYRLVESYIKKHDMDIEQETAFNWELVNYIRGALLEIASNIYRDKKKGGKPYEFPNKPKARTLLGQLNEKRNKDIDTEIKQYYKARLQERKEKSNK